VGCSFNLILRKTDARNAHRGSTAFALLALYTPARMRWPARQRT
jgi:hypothetical protein